MSAISFLEALKRKRGEHLEALALVPDGDALKHAGIKGQMRGLAEAAELFKAEMKIDDEEKNAR